jgi:hypothetical protein
MQLNSRTVDVDALWAEYWFPRRALTLCVWAFNMAPAVPRGPLTLCPQLCVGISPRRYTEIGLLPYALGFIVDTHRSFAAAVFAMATAHSIVKSPLMDPWDTWARKTVEGAGYVVTVPGNRAGATTGRTSTAAASRSKMTSYTVEPGRYPSPCHRHATGARAKAWCFLTRTHAEASFFHSHACLIRSS